MPEPHELTALEQYRELQAGHLSPVELTEHYLTRIDRLNDTVGAFVTVTADAARRRARDVQDLVPRDAPLWGLPSGDKDLWPRAGVRCLFGSRAFAGFVPDQNADIVTALDDAGAVSLGKTNTPEFGLPSYTESRVAPPARTPWNLSRNAGGSSGGAAAAVAAGMLPFAPGSDGGGSIRIPAGACGLVGVKPSRGRVPSGSGLASLAGLGVAGPIARTVADAALLLDGMIGCRHGRADHHYALRAPGPDGPFLDATRGAASHGRLAVMTTSAWDSTFDIALDPGARAALQRAAEAFAGLGHDVEETALRPDDTYGPAFHTVWQAGAATIPVDGNALNEVEPLTAWLIGRGRALSARQLGEALAALTAYERSFIAQLSPFDAVLTPATALTPRAVGWYDAEDGERNFAQQCRYTPFTSMVNVAGLPAMVLPVHQTDDGLPMGVQLIGRPGGERTLFALGAQLERALPWIDRHPPVW